jgi:ubiquinone biosynthesis accessory factor UbiK
MQVKDINQWVQQIVAALPPALQQLPQNLHQSLRDAIASTLNKCDLVTREEFDAQAGVLLKTRTKLEQLEKRLKELEGSLSDQ